MKNILTSGIFILLLISVSGITMAQSLVIRQMNGYETTELLGTLQKLTFSEGELFIKFKSGQTDTYDLSDIRKLYFDTGTDLDENAPETVRGLTLYPNPAGDYIWLDGMPAEEGVYRIFGSDGQLIMNGTTDGPTMMIDVSHLAHGLYFISVNGFSSKFVKK